MPDVAGRVVLVGLLALPPGYCGDPAGGVELVPRGAGQRVVHSGQVAVGAVVVLALLPDLAAGGQSLLDELAFRVESLCQHSVSAQHAFDLAARFVVAEAHLVPGGRQRDGVPGVVEGPFADRAGRSGAAHSRRLVDVLDRAAVDRFPDYAAVLVPFDLQHA
ncbi:hypothetical protein [Amycolatopsis sp. WGS_07]|uniref:hypothetical protein n=1 Tax=Amycolatopsis sp. WGS_07 TaxID=3076764 RepID=UPI0038739A63